MLDWYEKEYNVKLNIRFEEEIEKYNFEDVIDKIKKM